MKIALIAKLFAPVSPFSTGGTETFVYNLARELHRRGHRVTVFASGGSRIDDGIKLIPLVEESYWQKYSRDPDLFKQLLVPRRAMGQENIGYLKALFYLRKNLNSFDIIHDHSLHFLPLVLHHYLISLPLVATLHVPVETSKIPSIIKELDLDQEIENYYVAISQNQKNNSKNLKIFEINYNGIDEKRFKFFDRGGDDLIWVGRIVPEKGLDKAIEVAVKTKSSLKIIGSIADETYFKTKITPMIKEDKNISYLGEKTGSDLINLYQQAKILLFPIDWEEPFGLVMVEALSCGTPVVAFRRGSVPEIIKDGQTGFICPPGDIEAMTKATKKIYAMPEEEYQAMRKTCRKHVEENFTVEKMVDGYERVYEKVIEDYKSKIQSSNAK